MNKLFILILLIAVATTAQTLADFQSSLPGLEFVEIPGGTFVMGSPLDEPERDDDEKQHRVTISPFQMQRTEVTQLMWETVMSTTMRQQLDKSDRRRPLRGAGKKYPIYTVSWEEAQEFIKRLNQGDPGKNYRLPTEAQWEYACRAGTSTSFYAGDSISDLESAGWCSGNSGNRTHYTGLKEPNLFGLYDMHGNVWEWCEDRYGAYPDSSATDPSGVSAGTRRICRGGSYGNDAGSCRAANRSDLDPDKRSIWVGFRLVRDSLSLD